MNGNELRAILVRKAVENGDAVGLKAAMEIADSYLIKAVKIVEEAENDG